MEKLQERTEVQEELGAVGQRRCLCPICRSRDVWKWGKPTLTDRFMKTFFNKSALTCRRCGYKFHRKVIFGQVN